MEKKNEGVIGGLLITRKAHDSVLIGKEIEIIVERTGHNQALLRIKAPKELKIIRKDAPKEKKN